MVASAVAFGIKGVGRRMLGTLSRNMDRFQQMQKTSKAVLLMG